MYQVSKIRYEMQRRGWTKSQLALKAGLSVSTVHRMFDVGSAHPQNVKKLASVVGLKLEDLLEDPSDDKPKRKKAS